MDLTTLGKTVQDATERDRGEAALRYIRRKAAMERLKRWKRTERPPGADPGAGSTTAGARDLRLVQRALVGDGLAVEQLTDRLQCLSRILRHHSRRLRRPIPDADLQDLAQDTAFVLWKKLEQFDGRASLETWAYRFCTLQLLAFLRRSERGMHLVEDYNRLESEHESLRSEESSDPTIDIEHSLLILDEEELDVVRAKHFEGLTFDAMAERIGTSPNTAKTRYYRALLKLRGHLRGRYPEIFGASDEEGGA